MRLDFAPLFRSTVGYDRLLDLLDSASETAQGYPPYNIERIEENRYRITIAVAGFGEKDLSAEVRDGVLYVAGKREDGEKSSYLYHGIAGRAFERRFQLAEHVEVKGAKLENGLLHIELERVVPEEKKPRRISINAPDLKTIEGQAKAA
jgi:molecular chaperone IbpA